MSTKGHSIAHAQGFIGNCKVKTEAEKEAELQEHIELKMSILDDFFEEKKKPSKKKKNALLREMKSKTTVVGIDNCFDNFINNK